LTIRQEKIFPYPAGLKPLLRTWKPCRVVDHILIIPKVTSIGYLLSEQTFGTFVGMGRLNLSENPE